MQAPRNGALFFIAEGITWAYVEKIIGRQGLSEVFKEILPNGLRVVAWPMHGIDTASIIVLTKAGRRYEDQKTNGLTHFLEHMFARGGDRYTSKPAVSAAIEGVGGIRNAFTNSEELASYATVPADKLSTVFDVISDIILTPKFRQADVVVERGAVAQEIARKLDNPDMPIQDAFSQLWWGDQPLAWDTLGTLENISGFSRRDCLSFFRAYCIAPSTVIGVAGNVDPHRIAELALQYFGGMQTGTPPILQKAFRNPNSDSSQSIFVDQRAAQDRLFLGIEAPNRLDLRYPGAQVLCAILGGGSASRLFIEIRHKRGWAYGVGSSYWVSHDYGIIACTGGIAQGKVVDAIHVCIKELKNLAHGHITQDDFERAQNYVCGGMARGAESSFNVAHSLAAWELRFGGARSPVVFRDEIRNVTLEDVRRLAEELFTPEKYALAVTGPQTIAEADLTGALYSRK